MAVWGTSVPEEEISDKVSKSIHKAARKLAENDKDRTDALAALKKQFSKSKVGDTVLERIFDEEAAKVRNEREGKAARKAAKAAKVKAVAETPVVEVTEVKGNPTSDSAPTSGKFVAILKKHPVKLALAAAVVLAVTVTGVCHCIMFLGNDEKDAPVINSGITQDDLDNAEQKGKNDGILEGKNEANEANNLQNKRDALSKFFADAETPGSIKSQVQRAQDAKERAEKSAEAVPAAQEYADLAGDEYVNATTAENNALNDLNGRDINKMTEAEVDELTNKAKEYYDEAKEAADKANDYALQAQEVVHSAVKAPVELTFDETEVERVANIVKGANGGKVTGFKTSTYLNGTLTLYFDGLDPFKNKGIFRTQVEIDNPQYTAQDVINALEEQHPGSDFFASERKGVSVENSDLNISSKDENGNVQNATMEDVSVNLDVTYNKVKDRTTINYTILVELADGTFTTESSTIYQAGKLTKDEAYKLVIETYQAEHKVEQSKDTNMEYDYDEETNTLTITIEGEEQE